MRQYGIWVYLEIKKAMKTLPIMLLEAVVLMLVIGTIAFCTNTVANEKDEKAIIGVVMEEEGPLTDKLIEMIGEMDSISSYFLLQELTLMEGKKQLEEGRIVALIVLPKGLISGILNGQNIPASVYLPRGYEGDSITRAVETLLRLSVEELKLAQGQIYALYDLQNQLGLQGDIAPMLLDINLYNLNFIMFRDEIYNMPDVSLTGVLPLKNQYIAMFLSLYTLLTVLSIYPYLKCQNKIQQIFLHQNGVSYTSQRVTKISIIFCLHLCNILMMSSLLAITIGNEERLFFISGFEVITLFLAIGIISSLVYVIFQGSKDKKSSLLIYIIVVIGLGYFSGLFLPSSLLAFGDWTKYLPTTMVKEICYGLVSK